MEQCPLCGGTLKIIAAIAHPPVIIKILAHLGLPSSPRNRPGHWLEFRRLMKRGRSSLLIGLLFLAACLIASRLLLGSHEGTWASVARESLSIAGWVAMWRPMEIYLYDWWPVRGRGRIYKKLSQLPVEVVRRD